MRSHRLDALKGMLIGLVCIGHASQFIVHHGQSFWNDPLFKGIYLFHMPLFMAVAGRITFHQSQRLDLVRSLIWRRLRAYLLPILAWSFCIYLIRIFLRGKVGSPVEFATFTLNGFWFLWVLLIFCILTALIDRLAPWRTLIFSALYGLMLLLPAAWHFPLMTYTFPFFLIGYISGSWGSMFQKSSFHPVFLSICCAMTVLGYEFWGAETYVYHDISYPNHVTIGRILFRTSISSFAAIIALWLMLTLWVHCGPSVRRGLSWIGHRTMHIYVIQSAVFLGLARMMPQVTSRINETASGCLVAVVIGIIITVGCAAIGNLLARIPLLSIILFGKRHDDRRCLERSPLSAITAPPSDPETRGPP